MGLILNAFLVLTFAYLTRILFVNLFYPWYILRKVPTVSALRPLAELLHPINVRQRFSLLKKATFPGCDESELYFRKVFFFGRWLVICLDPVLFRKAYLNYDVFAKLDLKIYPTKSLSQIAIGKDNLLISNGETWRSMRKVFNPIFKKTLEISTLAKLLDKMINLWKKDADDKFIEIEVNGWMQRITLDVIGDFVFDYDFKALSEPNSEIVSNYNALMEHAGEAWPIIWPAHPILKVIPFIKEFHLLAEKFNGTLHKLIEEKRAKPGKRDIITMMLDEKVGLSPEEIRSNAFVFFLAGHDTTSTSLSAALFCLSKYPDVQEKLYEEVMRTMGEDNLPTNDDLSRMDYLNCVIKEVLRLAPPVANAPPRVVTRDFQLGEVTIPKGCLFNLPIYEVHHLENQWKDPESFRPERFLKDDVSETNDESDSNEAENHTSQPWFPFGYGPRSCIGMSVALTELRFFLATIVKRFKLKSLSDSNELEFLPATGTLNRLAPYKLRLFPRSALDLEVK